MDCWVLRELAELLIGKSRNSCCMAWSQGSERNGFPKGVDPIGFHSSCGHAKGNMNWYPEHMFLLQQDLINWEGWEVKVSHCFRETNQVADMLVNIGTSIN